MSFSLSSNIRGHLQALAATVLWSGTYVVARGMAESMPPVELSLWRWGTALVCLLPFTMQSLRAHAGDIRRHLPILFLISLVGFACFTTFVFVAGQTTEAVNMSLLAATSPIFMAAFSRIFFKERLSGRQVGGLCAAIVGVLVLITKGDAGRLLHLNFTSGDIWMLVGAMLFAVYSILVRYRPQELPQLTFLAVITGIAFFCLIPATGVQILFGEPLRMPSAAGFAGIFYLGAVASVTAYFFWNIAIAHIGAVRAGIVYYSLPLFGSILAFFFLGERMNLAQMVGGALIIGGILFSSLSSLASLGGPGGGPGASTKKHRMKKHA